MGGMVGTCFVFFLLLAYAFYVPGNIFKVLLLGTEQVEAL